MLRPGERGFDSPDETNPEDRQRAVSNLVVVALSIHLSPVKEKVHIDAVCRLLDDSYADYYVSEVRTALTQALRDGLVATDRLGRLVPPRTGGASRELVRRFERSHAAAAAVADHELPRLPG
jgi:hypothetical protein